MTDGPDHRGPGPARRPPRAAHPAHAPHSSGARRRPHRPLTSSPVPAPADGPGQCYHVRARRRPWWKLASRRPARNPSPGCAPGSSRSTGPATATWPPPSAPAGTAHDLCLYGLDILAEPVVRALPAAPPHPGPAVRPGRVPGPHPARPGRPAQDRDQPAAATPAAPPSPGPEHAMTDATLRQALAYARRGWPVFPCLPGQKIPATPHGYRDATTDQRADHRLVRPPPGLEPGHRHRRPRPRRPGRRPARPGRERLPRVPPAPRRRAARRRRPSTCAPPAAACTPTSPAPTSATATCPPPPGLPLRTAATSWPRPPRSTASPTSSSRPARWPRRPGLGRRHPAAATPAPAAPPRSPQPGAPGHDLGHLARWVAAQPEGNRNAGLFWAANRALDADPAADLSPLADAARQAGLRRPRDHPHPGLRPPHQRHPLPPSRPPSRGQLT